MTTEEIIDGNCIIAKFMGGYMRDKGHGNMIWDHSDRLSPLVCKSPCKLEYHKNWSWLMPVLEKISRIEMAREYDKETGEYTVFRHHPVTFGMLNWMDRPMVRLYGMGLFDAQTLIEATYIAVVDFIKFYNENKNEQATSK